MIISPYKLAILVIFGSPVFYYATKFTLQGFYNGAVKHQIGPIKGLAAIAIGVYSLLMFLAFWGSCGWVLYRIFR